MGSSAQPGDLGEMEVKGETERKTEKGQERLGKERQRCRERDWGKSEVLSGGERNLRKAERWRDEGERWRDR